MALYEYQCEKCGESFEVIQKFSDEPLTTHEKCGGKVQRLISTSALQFKGSGWYVTDYAKSSKPESDGSPKKSDAAPAGTASPESARPASSSASPPEKKTASSDTKKE